MNSDTMQCDIHVPDTTDRYLSFLGFVLFGYAVFGKGFAYIGVPPVFIGEVCAVFGLIAFFLSGRFLHALLSVPSVLLVLLMFWTICRTLPYVDIYGIDAVRDSVIVMYGLFAFVVAAIVMTHPKRIALILERYFKFITLFLVLAPATLLATRYAEMHLPKMLFTTVPIILMKSGDAGVHIGGAAIAVLVGFYHAKPLVLCCGVITFALVATETRGGLLAALIPFALAAILAGHLRRLASVVIAGIVGVLCLYFVETHVVERVPSGSERRPLSVTQLVENIASIVVETEARSDVHGTREWRLLWWKKIIDDTVHGPNFWTGRGFGINLAEADGFLGSENEGLRSPHNGNMTILARSGVPGLVLWTLLLCTWFVSLIAASLQARAIGEFQWQGLFVFVACYGLGFIINASFDVALEGPMQGIWFWCVFGFGIGARAMFRAGFEVGVDQNGSG